ncbi:MAG: permease [Pseudomonadota bacterium]
MSLSETSQTTRPRTKAIYFALCAAMAAATLTYPAFVLDTARFVLLGLVHVAPLIIPGVMLSAWITASGASDRVADVFHGRTLISVVSATMIGALLPVCGITVLPLMASLLAGGVPLAPVMAFWLASPITGPAMLSATVATLGWEFAAGKTAAAVMLGLLGGGVTSVFSSRDWVLSPLRSNSIVGTLGPGCGQCVSSTPGFRAWIWTDAVRRRRFFAECRSVSRLILLVLIPAFTAEHLLNAWLKPGAVTGYLGDTNAFAVPFAVLVGGPAYIDGYAALPLTRTLLDHGMSPAAAMAFLVSGGVVSVWGALAIFPVLRFKPFCLYLILAAIGSMLSGWGFGYLY